MGKCSDCKWCEEEPRLNKEPLMKCKNPVHIRKQIKKIQEVKYICLNRFASECEDFEKKENGS